MIRLRVAVVQASTMVALLVATVAALRDQIAYATRVPARSHVDAWSFSEDERLLSALQGWYPTFDGQRKATPESAVIGGWLPVEDPPAGGPELFDLLRVTLAPRIGVPLRSADDIAIRHEALLKSGLPIFLIEIHPAFGPEWARARRPARLDSSIGTLALVAEHADFTLHELRPRR